MFNGLMSIATGGIMLFGAFSSSSSYQLQTYGIGSGGTGGSSSPSYRLNASSGEVGTTAANGSTTQIAGGSIESKQANVPLAPTLSNGANIFYNKLQITINTSGSDPSDYQYSIAISSNNFVTTNYVQADGTLAGSPVYQTYTAWGGVSGSFATGLSPNTTYKVKVNARQGAFTESAYGPEASAATANPALSFAVTPSTVNLGNLLPGTVVTGGTPISFNFATNGASGGWVYVSGANGGLRSTAANNTISSASVDLSGQSQGFGLNRISASSTAGTTPSFAAAYNGTGSAVGLVDGSFRQLFGANAYVTGGTAQVNAKGKSSINTPSATDYRETLTFIAAASF